MRTVLVPASMELLGRWNWYLPSWLSWLPEIHLGEGAHRDAAVVSLDRRMIDLTTSAGEQSTSGKAFR